MPSLCLKEHPCSMHIEIIKDCSIASCKRRSNDLETVKDAKQNNVATTIDPMMFFLTSS
jgi:hypothetical protein